MDECRALVADGARELVLVAQDTALYGTDLYGEVRLPELLREIDGVCRAGGVWLRLMYAYPEHITPALIQTMAELPTVCKYLDMPIQHSEDTVLARMGRTGSRQQLTALTAQLRAAMPDIVLRTTIMVGFPGETAAEFEALYDFVQSQQFDRLGVFPYSQEDGTPAAAMPRQVKEQTKHTRRERIMTLQQTIHGQKQQQNVGRVLDVMIDEATDMPTDIPEDMLDISAGYYYVGRTQGDAHEVDAVVYITSERELAPGEIVQVDITAATAYDLIGSDSVEPAE